EGCQIQLGQQLPEPCAPGLSIESHGFKNGQDILLNSESPEDGRFLGQVADTLSGSHIHGVVGDIDSVELDPSRVGCGEADRHVEGRGLAGSIGSQETDDFAGCDLEVHTADDSPPVVRLRQLEGPEGGHRGGWPKSLDSWTYPWFECGPARFRP